MSKPDTAMIFAAGRGTRMLPLTASMPKPLVRVAGRALLDHALDLAAAGGVGRAVVNSHYLGDQIAAHLASGAPLKVTHVPDGPDLLDTGGGMRAARAALGDAPVFTLNSDAVFSGPNPLAVLRAGAARWPEGGACLLLVPRGQAVGHAGVGDFNLGPDGDLIRRSAAPEADYIYTGVQWIAPAAVYACPDAGAFSLNVVWNAMAARGALRGVVYPGKWCDVGQPASIPLAEAMLAEAVRK